MAKKRTDDAILIQKAQVLARSGAYQNWLSIEFALRAQGFADARAALNQDWVRERLDELCADARAAKTPED